MAPTTKSKTTHTHTHGRFSTVLTLQLSLSRNARAPAPDGRTRAREVARPPRARLSPYAPDAASARTSPRRTRGGRDRRAGRGAWARHLVSSARRGAPNPLHNFKSKCPVYLVTCRKDSTKKVATSRSSWERLTSLGTKTSFGSRFVRQTSVKTETGTLRTFYETIVFDVSLLYGTRKSIVSPVGVTLRIQFVNSGPWVSTTHKARPSNRKRYE